MFAAFAARGVDARPAVYNLAQADELRDQLLECDGALVWVNPIDAGRSRAPLDALLRDVAAAGVVVSTHPDAIMKLGTKDVLVDTRAMAGAATSIGSTRLDQLRAELRARLATGSIRVLKQWRGHSGIGVWRVQRDESPASSKTSIGAIARHAVRGSPELRLSLDELRGADGAVLRGMAATWSTSPGSHG